jgi:hypothetical protein
MNKKAVIEDNEIEVVEEETEVSEIVEEEEPEDTEEVVVSIGEEAPPLEDQPPEHQWAAKMRVENRELKRKARELEARLQSTAPPETKPVVIGNKPKLEDHDYDADKYEEALTNWFDRKRQADDVNAKQEAEVMNQQKAWQAKLDGYGKAKAELRVKDFEDAEEVAQQVFSITQQGVLLQGADNPALVVYALGKNPAKAKELAEIKDPVKFAFAVAKLEKDLKVTNRRQAPAPERIISGTGRSSGAVDSTLERLRADAERTGNMTKVIAYKAQKRSASK